MLTFLQYLADELRLFRYISFRSAMAAGTALLIAMVIAPWIIRKLRAFKAAQAFREASEVGKLAELHAKKVGTPTMGGLIIYFSVTTSTLLWARPNVYVFAALLIYTGLTVVGFLDDFIKIRKRKSGGLKGRYKLLGQGIVTLATLVLLLEFGGVATGPDYAMSGSVTERMHVGDPVIDARIDQMDPSVIMEAYTSVSTKQLWVPFWKQPLIAAMPLALLIPFLFVVLAGSSNAINLTDGMDGLAIGCTVTVALVFGIMSYAAGHAIIADYLFLRYLPGTGELTVICAALVAGSLGFLWYNAHPASVFMGDTGSLAIGGLIGGIAFMIQQPFTLVIVGGIFVMEAMSVILQVASFKSRGKRIFRMSPIHHHFELGGWAETQVVIRFWILSMIFAMAGLATLKLR